MQRIQGRTQGLERILERRGVTRLNLHPAISLDEAPIRNSDSTDPVLSVISVTVTSDEFARG